MAEWVRARGVVATRQGQRGAEGGKTEVRKRHAAGSYRYTIRVQLRGMVGLGEPPRAEAAWGACARLMPPEQLILHLPKLHAEDLNARQIDAASVRDPSTELAKRAQVEVAKSVDGAVSNVQRPAAASETARGDTQPPAGPGERVCIEGAWRSALATRWNLAGPRHVRQKVVADKEAYAGCQGGTATISTLQVCACVHPLVALGGGGIRPWLWMR
jgi:hypothetical protein